MTSKPDKFIEGKGLVSTTSAEWSILCLFFGFFYIFLRLKRQKALSEAKKSIKETKNVPFMLVVETNLYYFTNGKSKQYVKKAFKQFSFKSLPNLSGYFS